MHLKGANSMAASELGCRKALVGTGWANSLLLCMNGLRKQISGLLGPPFPTLSLFFSVYTGSDWLRAMTIENSLISGCGLSHESAEDGYKDSWMKFEHNPREQGIWYIYGIHKFTVTSSIQWLIS